MLAIFIPLAALLLSDALLLIGHGLLLTLLPVAASQSGFTELEIALTGSAYFLGFVCGCFLTPHVLNRVGHIRSFAILAALYSATVLVLGWLSLFAAWVMLRFLVGASISGLYTVIESWLNERAKSSNRGIVLSTYTMLNLLMITLAQQLLIMGESNTLLLFSLAALFITLAIIPVSLTLTLAPAPVKSVKINLRKVWQHSHTAMVGAVVAGMVTGSFWSLAPVFAKSLQLSSHQIAAFMSATILGGAFFQVPLGRISDRFDRRIVLFYCALAGTLISVCVFAASSSTIFIGWPLTLLAFLWGGSCMTFYAIALSHANDNAAASDFVEIGSGMLITLGVSSAIGAPVASLLMSVLGPQGLYLFMGFCLALFAAHILVRIRNHILPFREIHAVFRPVPNLTTPAVYEMDPRNEEAVQMSNATEPENISGNDDYISFSEDQSQPQKERSD